MERENLVAPRIVLVGSPPPPFHGQAIITELVFKLPLDWASKEIVEARFSETIDSVGRFGFSKISTLAKLAVRIFQLKLKHPKAVLYYCAGSTSLVSLIKDAVLLGVVGRYFARVVVHYHSGGLPQSFEESFIRRTLGKIAFSHANTAIGLTEAVEVPCFRGTKKLVVPNGLPIHPEKKSIDDDGSGRVKFLFVGALCKSKGVGVLLEAADLLVGSGTTNFEVTVVGEWRDDDESKEILCRFEDRPCSEHVRFVGRVVGDDKWEVYRGHDVFVFPTFYESENQPLVIIEAMALGLPVISTRWRGIPEMVDHGESGFLVQPEGADELKDVMIEVLGSPALRKAMSEKANQRFSERFSYSVFAQTMEQIFKDESNLLEGND